MEKIKTNILKLKPYFASNVFKTVVFLILAFFVAFGVFIIENDTVYSSDADKVIFSSFDYDSENIIPTNGLVKFASEGDSSFNNSVLVENPDDSYLFKIKSAKFWANFAISDAKINLLLDRVVLIPDHAVFDLSFDGNKLTLQVFNGDVYLGYLYDDLVLDAYQDKFSPILKNKILVSKGMLVDFNVGKILDDRILYSKLAKEFKLSAIPGENLSSDWVLQNKSSDVVFLEQIKNDAFSKINDLGLSVHGGFVGKLIFSLQKSFTFVSNKKNDVYYNHIFAYLDDSIYFASNDDKLNSDARFNDFKTNSEPFFKDDKFWNKLNDHISFLSVFDVQDPQYYVLLNVLDLKMANEKDLNDVMSLIVRGVYMAVSSDKDFLATNSVNLYFKYLSTSLKVFENQPNYVSYLEFTNQFLDNLFAKYPVFYVGDFMTKKRDLIELKLLDAYVSDPLLDENELKNHYIDRKIILLKNLQNFFFDERLTVPQAKSLFIVLFSDVNALMPTGSSDLAVVGLFEQRLSTIADFWGYLNSPEYYASRSYGVAQRDRYAVYKEEKPFVATILGLRDEVLGVKSDDDVTMDNAVALIESAFIEVDGMTSFEVGDMSSVSQRNVPVKGVIDGYPFEAIFDRDKVTVKDVYVYGELLIDRPVKIDAMLPVFKNRFANLDEAKSQKDEKITETYAERFAIMYVASVLTNKGFSVSVDDIFVLDKMNAVYRVEKASASGHEEIVLTFDLYMNKESVTNLLVTLKGEPFILKGEYTLLELHDVAVSGEFTGGVKR